MEKQFNTANDILKYYRQKYFEAYGIHYLPNFGRDLTLIKSKLMKTFSNEEIKTIIDIAFREYPIRWETSKFPVLTVGALSSWIANEALLIAVRDA